MFFCKLIFCCIVLAEFAINSQADPIARLIGGQDVDSLERFPHHVYIIPLQTGRKCGGSILNAQWILTSAACISDSPRVELHFGKKNQGAADYFTCSVNSDQVYEYPTKFDDLALIRLPLMLVFSDSLKPINLSRLSTEALRNKFVVMPGFNDKLEPISTTAITYTDTPSPTTVSRTTVSRTTVSETTVPETTVSPTIMPVTKISQTKGRPTPSAKKSKKFPNKRSDDNSDNLKYGMFNILDNKVCEKSLGSKFDEYTQICTEGWGKNNNTSCNSDFGSGLIAGWPAKSELVGMFSMHSPSCDINKPAVFTYVAKYLSWIDSMIQG